MLRELNELEYVSFAIGQPFNIAVMLKINGKLSEELLKSTFKKLQKKHPLMKVRITFDENDRPWFTNKGVGDVPIKIVPRKNDTQALNEFHKQLITPFDLQRNDLPLIRVVLFLSTEKSELIICAMHTISDGISMTYLCRDMIKFMINPDLLIEPIDPHVKTTDIFPKKVKRIIPETRFFSYFFYVLIRIYYFFRFTLLGRKRPAKLNIDENDMGIYTWKYSPKKTNKIITNCKEKNVSVHSFLCTAFLPEFPTIGSTINLRDRLKPDLEGAFGFLSTALIFKQKYRKKASFWKNVKRYQKKLKRNLRNRKVFFLQKIFSKKASYEFLQKMGTYFVEVATKKEPFSVNNLGLLDDYLQDVDLDAFLPIDSFHGGMTSFLNILIVMVYTLQNEMHFHCHFIKTKYTMEEIKSLAKTVNKRIENAL